MYFIHRTYAGMVDACAKKPEPYVWIVENKLAIRVTHEKSLNNATQNNAKLTVI